MKILGIDPGRSCGIAVVEYTEQGYKTLFVGQVLFLHRNDIKHIKAYFNSIVEEYRPKRFFRELGWGVTRAAQFQLGIGQILTEFARTKKIATYGLTAQQARNIMQVPDGITAATWARGVPSLGCEGMTKHCLDALILAAAGAQSPDLGQLTDVPY